MEKKNNRLEDFKKEAEKMNKYKMPQGNICPHCGYCPTCGRPWNKNYPPYYPWWNNQPYCGGGGIIQ